MVRPGTCTFGIRIDEEEYYIGRSQSNPDTLGIVLSKNFNHEPPIFELKSVQERSGFLVLFGGQFVNKTDNDKLRLGNDPHHAWKFVYVNGDKHMITLEGTEEKHWTLERLPQNGDRGLEPLDTRTPSYLPISSSTAGEIVFGGCTGCPSHCAILITST